METDSVSFYDQTILAIQVHGIVIGIDKFVINELVTNLEVRARRTIEVDTPVAVVDLIILDDVQAVFTEI